MQRINEDNVKMFNEVLDTLASDFSLYDMGIADIMEKLLQKTGHDIKYLNEHYDDDTACAELVDTAQYTLCRYLIRKMLCL